MRNRHTWAAVIAVLVVVLGLGGVAVGSSVMTAAVPVPECTPLDAGAKHNDRLEAEYNQCMHERTQAMIENGLAPAPTVTETVEVPGPTVTETVTVTPEPTPTPTPTPTPGTITNQPAQPAGLAYNSSTGLVAYEEPGALVIAGRDNYGDDGFKRVSNAGGHVLIYIDPIVDNAYGRYADLMLNASTCGAVVPDWPGPVTANSSGNLTDFRPGSVLQGKFECVLEKMVSENPHMAGFFLDDVGSRSWFPGFSWSAFGDANQQDYRNGAIDLVKTARKVADKYGLIVMVNGTWQAGSLNGGGGGYPDMNTHGLSLAEGGFVENHTLDAFWENYGCGAQWADASPITNGKAFMYAQTTTSGDMTAFRDSDCYAYVQHQTDYGTPPAPWGPFHATGLPTKVTNPTTPEPEPVTFPTRSSVGPAVDPTEVWTGGDCYFNFDESGTVVDGKILNCDGEGIRFHKDATGIVFRNSILRGGFVTPGYLDDGGEGEREPIFTVEDSKIIQDSQVASWPDRALYGSHYTVRRSLIQGSHSAVGAHTNVKLTGNFITTDGTSTHQSGVRMLKNSVLKGNTVTCKPVNAGIENSGCSAHGVFYREAMNGDNKPAFNLTIEDNWFKRGVTDAGEPGGGYFAVRFIDCAAWTDCTGISFQRNQFSVGEGTDGGEFPFYADNVWADNYWDDGQPAESGQNRW